MDIVNPDPSTFLLPDNSKVVVYAEHQPEYENLPSIRTPDGRVVSQWRPSDEELKMLFAGHPITLVVWTHNQPLQPVALAVGGVDLR